MIPHNRPSFDAAECLASTRALGSGWVAQGPEVESFENELCQYLGLPEGHAVAVSSGSAALFLALWVSGASTRRIGLPVYGCSALRNAVALAGGECVYLDCKEGTPNVDVRAALDADVDILIAPSMYGIPIELPVSRSCKVVEDVAQSLGASVAGERIGLRGEVGICSFYATKLMTTGGQGGAVISRDKSLIDSVRDYRDFDHRDDAKLRFNFQMTDIQAAIGRVQLGKLPAFLAQRERLFGIYIDAGLDLLGSSIAPDIRPVRYRAVMHCDDPRGLIETLRKNGVSAIVPLERWELLDQPERYPVAEQASVSSVSLPVYPTLPEEEARRIATIARDFT